MDTDANPPQAFDLTKKEPQDIAPEPFFNVVGFGQYPITVLDHANGMATFANGGIYNKAHFVVSVEQQDKDTGKWETVGGEKLKPKQRIDQAGGRRGHRRAEADPGADNHSLDDGRQAAGKTGTWE